MIKRLLLKQRHGEGSRPNDVAPKIRLKHHVYILGANYNLGVYNVRFNLTLIYWVLFFSLIQFCHCTLNSRKIYHPQFRDTQSQWSSCLCSNERNSLYCFLFREKFVRYVSNCPEVLRLESSLWFSYRKGHSRFS